MSDNGGVEALWGRNGTSLYYRDPQERLIEVKVTTGDSFSIGSRSVVLSGDYLTDATHANYDVGPDGRFLMLRRSDTEAQTVIVHNWARELREKTARR